ncbi:hypothetical protein ACFPRL_34555 [Pseudoclavibacter helvolus]
MWLTLGTHITSNKRGGLDSPGHLSHSIGDVSRSSQHLVYLSSRITLRGLLQGSCRRGPAWLLVVLSGLREAARGRHR